MFGAEFLGHDFGGGLAALDSRDWLWVGLGFARFGFHMPCSNWLNVDVSELMIKPGGLLRLSQTCQVSASGA